MTKEDFGIAELLCGLVEYGQREEKRESKRREILDKYHIRKVVNEPFNRLPMKQRAIFILHLAGFTYKELQKIWKVSSKTITKAVEKGYEEYHI